MNTTGTTDEEMCQLAYRFRKDWTIFGIVVIQALLSGFTLFLLISIYCSSEMRRIFSLISLDLKIVSSVGFLCYTVATSNAFIVFSYKFILLLFDFAPCTYVWTKFNCYLAYNLFSIVSVLTICFFHMSLFLERFLTTFGFKRFCYKGVLGTLMSLGVLIGSPMPHILNYNASFLEGNRSFCSTPSSTSNSKALIVIYTFIIMEFCVTIGDSLLFLFNRWQTKVYKRKANFNLQRAYFLREIRVTMSLIYPFSVVHSVTYCAQMMAYAKAKLIVTSSHETEIFVTEFTALTRILANLSVISFIWIYSQKQNRENSKVVFVRDSAEADLYFNQFKKMIG